MGQDDACGPGLMPRVLVITGPPCAGKSTLASELRARLSWPVIAKDAIKEQLFDALGVGDRAWSKRLSGASYAVLFAAADELLASGRDCILEANFRWSENASRFAALERTHPDTRWTQLFCTAPPDVLVTRLQERSGRRHAGHVDAAAATEIEMELRAGTWSRLSLPGPVFDVDTSAATSGALTALLTHLQAG